MNALVFPAVGSLIHNTHTHLVSLAYFESMALGFPLFLRQTLQSQLIVEQRIFTRKRLERKGKKKRGLEMNIISEVFQNHPREQF